GVRGTDRATQPARPDNREMVQATQPMHRADPEMGRAILLMRLAEPGMGPATRPMHPGVPVATATGRTAKDRFWPDDNSAGHINWDRTGSRRGPACPHRYWRGRSFSSRTGLLAQPRRARRPFALGRSVRF